MEIWKSIEGFEGIYEVSNLGRVRSLSRPKIGKSNSSDSINSASLYTDIIPYRIKLCADGVINQAGGYIWKYIK